jgi:3-phenylpropionate/trans-cinnamate dioxygenase alpha subunit
MDAPDALVSDDGTWVSRRLFSDPEVYRLEKERVFGRSWLFLGHESQLREPGDFWLTRMGEESVLVTRDRERRVRAFLNTCRHRGMRVCREDAGRARVFTCPYHGWSYAPDGRLVGVPDQRRAFPDGLDRDLFGLIPVARVEAYKGLLFGNFDARAEPLVAHLGDMTQILDVHLDRRAGGTEVLGVQKWIVQTNWKIPAENQVGDVAHGATSHASALALGGEAANDAFASVLGYGRNVALPNGHGGTVRVYPEDDLDGRLPGEAALRALPAVGEYLREVQPEAAERLGSPRDRFKIATATVFPNFSILGSNFTVRVAHPRGPTASEIWSWVIVDRDAPSDVKQALKQFYQFTFGPAGIFEQDDGENWEEVTSGAQGPEARRYAFYYGMGLGSDGPDAELPGRVSHVYSEHPQRSFYCVWRERMLDDEERAHG